MCQRPSARQIGDLRAITVAVTVTIVGIVTGITFATNRSGADDGAPWCAQAYVSASPSGSEGALPRSGEGECVDEVNKWCLEHHPEDESGCVAAVLIDGDVRNAGKNGRGRANEREEGTSALPSAEGPAPPMP